MKNYKYLPIDNKVFGYEWLYKLSSVQWRNALDHCQTMLGVLQIEEDDDKLVHSLRDDSKKRFAVIIGAKYASGFEVINNQLALRFYTSDLSLHEKDERFFRDDFTFKDGQSTLVYCYERDWKGMGDPLFPHFQQELQNLYQKSGKSSYKRSHCSFMHSIIFKDDARSEWLEWIELSPQKRLIETYKKTILNDQNKEELYKWNLLIQFQKIWTLDTDDFGSVLKQVDFKNLISQQSYSFLTLAKKHPDEALPFFKEVVFNENNTLKKRIKETKEAAEILIRKWHPTWKAQQDENTFSMWLSFANIEKYTPYKPSFYKKYCNHLGIKPAKAGERYIHYLELMHSLKLNFIVNDDELLKLHGDCLSPEMLAIDHNYNLLTQNILYKVYDQLWTKEDQSEPNDNLTSLDNNLENSSDMPKKTSINKILYGPPGTGKTYSTIKEALKLCSPNEIDGMDRDAQVQLYHELVKKDRIKFVTFHQSFSYEDFVEGIKPNVNEDNDQVTYSVEDGIFKEMVNNAINIKNSKSNVQDAVLIEKSKFKKNINKVSLGNSLDAEDKAIFDYCMDNDCIAIGFGEDIDFSEVKTRQDIRKKYSEAGVEIKNAMDFNISAIERLVLWMNPGELVFVSWGNRILKAIGEVSGEYYLDKETPIRYSQFRKVKWLYKNLDVPIKEIYGKYFSQQSIYQISGSSIDASYFQKVKNKEDVEDFVLVIDEINRGNVSAIFGELITLLEADKRIGSQNELKVTLPYSKESFGVPSNLHIIGTMNTADRSVEALDTALRRRFTFNELLPNPSLLENRLIEGINLTQLLTIINERIEALVDRDHTIGHAYFISVFSQQDLECAIYDKVIPLLQEYFYGDYSKMELVLGNGFVAADKNSVQFAVKNADIEIPPIYRLKDVRGGDFIEALRQLMDPNHSSNSIENLIQNN